jgi:FtsH-binding integral membrane protein
MEDRMGYEYAYSRPVAARAETADRVSFIRRTYAHLGGAILAFMALEALLLAVVPHQAVLSVLTASPFNWLLVLGAFMVAGCVAQTWARSETSVAMQYAGLGLFVVAVAIIFLPLLILAADYFSPSVIPTAGLLTLAVFGGLTASVFISRKDFSFLRPILFVGSLLALGLIVCGVLFQFNLGVLFAFAMVALMSGYILYYTSNVMLYYRTDQHVAAALALFAAVATLFWYILQVVMRFSSRR